MFDTDEIRTRSTPTVPPGLVPPGLFPRGPFDFSELSGLTGIASNQALRDTPVFAGLGDEPSAPKPKQSPELSTTTTVKDETSAAEAVAEKATPEVAIPVEKKVAENINVHTPDDTAFPALPKVSAPAAAVPATKKTPGAAIGLTRKDSKDAKNTTEVLKAPQKVQDTEQTQPGATNTTADDTIIKSKRRPPGKIEIPAAADIIKSNIEAQSASKPSTPVLATREITASPLTTSHPSTPAATLDTPLRRVTQPRTIRVLPTPKVEHTGPAPVLDLTQAAAAFANASPATSKQASRQPSIASMNVPGTPVSEKISDTVSISTGYISRATSPAPSRADSNAPIKVKSKSQQKRERQERAKAEEKAGGESQPPSAVDSVVHEAIIGRKKKSKKPATPSSAVSTPTESRADTPGPAGKDKVAESPKLVEEKPIEVKKTEEKPKSKEIEKDVVKDVVKDTIPTASDESFLRTELKPPVAEPVARDTSTPPKAQVLKAQDPKPATADFNKKPTAYPAALFAELEISGDVEVGLLNLFKAATGANIRHEFLMSDLPNAAPPAPLTAKENARLDSGKPVRRGGEDGRVSSRVLITPFRTCLRGLAKEMEDRYLDLEKRVTKTKPPFKYNHRRDAAAATALMVEEMLKDLALALAQPANTNSATGGASNDSSRSGAGKNAIYGDDALAYLNQFILPPLPTRGKAGDVSTTPSPYSAAVGNAIPRTYTTGDPTYSVFGVDVSSNTTHESASNNPLTNAGAAAAAAANVAGLADRAAALTNLGMDVENGGDPAAIKKALANAVNGVVAAAAAGGFKGLGRLGERELLEALEISKKEYEKLEKRFNGMVKKNKRMAGM